MSKLLLAALAALALVPSAARAQQMPDPRQMSGTPRQDAQVKLGETTVRLVHGDLSKNAAEGSPVHLVALAADGTATRVTRAIDKLGRASFEGLAQDGSIAYYAFALLGEDRLESDLIVLDKMAGVRLMLVGRKLDAQGQPVGEVVDDAVGGDDQPMAQPPGEVWILLGGPGISAGAQVELVELAESGPGRVVQTLPAQASADNQFQVRFKDVPGGADKVYIARTRVGQKPFSTKPFMLRAGAGVGRTVLVVDQIIVTAHLAAELDDETMRVQVQYRLQNFSGGPYDPGPDGIVLPLPTGAIGGSLADESGRVKVDPGKEIIWRGVLPPGGSEIIAAFGLPVVDGVVAFEMAAPLGLFQSTLIVEQAAGSFMSPATVEMPANSQGRAPAPLSAQIREADNGRKFFVVGQVQVPKNSVLRFTVSGLPEHPRGMRLARNVAGLLVLLLVVAAVVVTVFDPFKRKQAAAAVKAPGPANPREALARRKELTSKREQLYDELVALERKRAAQTIDSERYETTRQTVVSRLTLVLRELDQLDSTGSTRAS